MCHSVDMYLPAASRRAAEERILEANAAAAAREQRVVDAVFRFAAWLRRGLGRGLRRGLRRGLGRGLRRRPGRRPAEAPMRGMAEHG